MSEESAEPICFNPLGEYELPKMPTVHALRRFATIVRQRFHSKGDDPVLANDRLQPTASREIDRIAAAPSHGSLLQELDRTLHDWCADAEPAAWVKMVVLPPGDESALLQSWARQHQAPQASQLLQAPSRTDILSSQNVDADALQGEGVLVIPDLAAWFLRHRSGLQTVRSLLTRLSQIERHCVVGCNSWAWAFLCRAVGANLLLPPAITFQAFDAQRLRHWFRSLSEGSDGAGAVTFRLADSGADVLAVKDGGELENAYLKRLAARSYGIPWVAWHLWRVSLRSRLEDNGLSDKAASKLKEATGSDASTIWVVGFEELALPRNHTDHSLLVLQALLIHGELDAAQLQAVLPHVGAVDLMPALVRASYVRRTGTQFQVLQAAYPQAREALAAGGYPLDRL